MGEMRNVYSILVGKPEGKRPLEDLYVDGKIILEWTEYICLIIGAGGGLLYTR
jgi:hypothetical protein